jgi:hypothetical protein
MTKRMKKMKDKYLEEEADQDWQEIMDNMKYF